MAADDLRNLLSVTRQMFATKNNDEALQRLVHYSREAAVASTGAATTTYTTGTAKDIGKKSGEMAMTTYNLVKLMARSDEFRRLMFDLVNIASDFSETGGISTESVDANAGQASSSVTAPVVLPAGKKTMADVVKAVQVEKKKGFSFRSVIKIKKNLFFFFEKYCFFFQNISDETKARFTERFKTWMTAINRREDFREGIRELIFSIDDFSQYAVDTGSDFLRNNNDVLSARENSALVSFSFVVSFLLTSKTRHAQRPRSSSSVSHRATMSTRSPVRSSRLSRYFSFMFQYANVFLLLCFFLGLEQPRPDQALVHRSSLVHPQVGGRSRIRADRRLDRRLQGVQAPCPPDL